jgi:hypothetical protein
MARQSTPGPLSSRNTDGVSQKHGEKCEAVRPRTWLVLQVADFAYAACGPQIFILRVSGIKYRLSTKHTAGTAIG